jgi:hypothetical protein
MVEHDSRESKNRQGLLASLRHSSRRLGADRSGRPPILRVLLAIFAAVGTSILPATTRQAEAETPGVRQVSTTVRVVREDSAWVRGGQTYRGCSFRAFFTFSANDVVLGADETLHGKTYRSGYVSTSNPVAKTLYLNPPRQVVGPNADPYYFPFDSLYSYFVYSLGYAEIRPGEALFEENCKGEEKRAADAAERTVGAFAPFTVSRIGAGISGALFTLSTTSGLILKEGEFGEFRLRVENDGDSVLTDVRVDSVAIVATDADSKGAATMVLSPTSDRRLRGTLTATGANVRDFQDYTFTPTLAGSVHVTVNVSGKEPDGTAVNGVITQDVTIKPTPLTVELTAKRTGGPARTAGQPLSFTLDKDKKKNKFVVDVRVTNNDETEITKVRFADPVEPINPKSLRVDNDGNPLPGVALKLLTSPIPVLEAITLAPKTSRTLTFQYDALDSAKVELSSRVTGVFDGQEVSGRGVVNVTATSNEKLAFSSKVDVPGVGELPAGLRIRVSGKIKNLSEVDTLIVGPPLPTVTGNAAQVFYYALGAEFGIPMRVEIPELIVLKPLEGRSFAVEIPTGQSDPRLIDGKGGGTRAVVNFTPWADVYEPDGKRTAIASDQIKATSEDLERNIAIDDSVDIPEKEFLVLARGLTDGGLVGVKNAIASLPGQAAGLLELPKAAWMALSSSEGTIFDVMTIDEKMEMLDSANPEIVGQLLKYEENGRKTAEERAEQIKQINALMLSSLTEMSNEWYVGDYESIVRKVSAFSSEQITGVAMPIVLGKMLKTEVAIAGIARASAKLEAQMAPVLARLNALKVIGLEAVIPAIESIASGTKIGARLLEKLYGIDALEAEELRQIAKEYKVLLYMRSRHESSIEWLNKWKAILKPEALKVKVVSDADGLLGYKVSDLGRLIFKKPLALIENEKSGKAVQVWFEEVMSKNGIAPPDPRYSETLGRLNERMAEWATHEEEYKHLNKIKQIDVGFNYKDNDIPDRLATNSSSYRGFNLKPVAGAEEEYVVEMTNRLGEFKSITGDIDGVMYTNLDGSPLSPDKHFALLERLRLSHRLGARHGESATYVNGGVEFIEKNLKGAAAILFTPEDSGIVVRFNKAKSTWLNPRNYYLHFDGTPIHYGGLAPDVPIAPGKVDISYRRIPVAPKPPSLLTTAQKNARFGRCLIGVSAASTGLRLRVNNDNGMVEKFVPSTTTGNTTTFKWASTNLSQQCLSEGPDIQLDLTASVVAIADAIAGANRIAIDVPPDGEPNAGFTIGDLVMLDPGGPNEETATVSGYGSLIFNSPLTKSHAAGEMIVVLSNTANSVNAVQATTTTQVSVTTTAVAGATSRSEGVGVLLIVPTLAPTTSTSVLANGGTKNTTLPAATAQVSVVTTATLVTESIGVIAVSAPIAAPAIGTGFGETSSVAYTGADVDSLIAVALAIIVLGLLLARRSKQVSARDAGNIRN